MVKCHEHRLVEHNRKLARERLQEKLDDFVNGELSVSAQKRKIDHERKVKAKLEAKLRLEAKLAFKARLAKIKNDIHTEGDN